MLRSDLCDCSDAYIVVKGTSTVQTENNRTIDGYNWNEILKNNAPFIKCILKINNALIDNAEILDIVIWHVEFEYSKNYSKTCGTLWNYTKDISAGPVTNSESIKHKTSITGKAANDGNTKEVEFFVPLKYLTYFWKIIDMPLINETMQDETTQDADPNANPPVPKIRAPTGAKFKIIRHKLYVPVVILWTEDDKLLEQLKKWFEKAIKWNIYRSEMYNQTKINNLNFLIDLQFNKANRLFVLSFENEEDGTSFSKYDTQSVAIKDLNVLINGKSFFDVPIKGKEETYEKIIEMSKNNDYTTGNLLDYDYFSNYYKLIAIDLSKQIELENPNLNNKLILLVSLKKIMEQQCFSSLKNQKNNFFTKRSVSIIQNGNTKDCKFFEWFKQQRT